MNKKMILTVLVATGLALPGAAGAAVCKDARGKFIKCPPTTSAPANPAASSAPAAKPAKVARVPHKICRDKKGRFTKCPA